MTPPQSPWACLMKLLRWQTAQQDEDGHYVYHVVKGDPLGRRMVGLLKTFGFRCLKRGQKKDGLRYVSAVTALEREESWAKEPPPAKKSQGEAGATPTPKTKEWSYAEEWEAWEALLGQARAREIREEALGGGAATTVCEYLDPDGVVSFMGWWGRKEDPEATWTKAWVWGHHTPTKEQQAQIASAGPK